MAEPPSQTHTAFFYGTLMAPSVLHRVISSSHEPSPYHRSTPLTFHPALLPRHRRHRVRNADYPAVVPVPPPTTSTVRGSYVTGLTPTDLTRLDIFEGAEYTRRGVRARLLPAKASEGGGVPEPLAYGGVLPGANPDGTMGENALFPAASRREQDEGGEEVETQTYIWTAGRDELEEREWDFEVFRREKLHLWAGRDVDDEGMREVDRQFGGNGAVDGTRGRGVDTRQFEMELMEKEGTANGVEVARNTA